MAYPPAGYPPIAYPPAAPSSQYGPVAVVGQQYCVPYNVDLVVSQKVMSLSGGDYTITDVNGGVMFKVKGKVMSMRDRRVLVDGAGNPIVTMKGKMMTAHRRWQVFRGDSSDDSALLFSAKKSSLLQFKTKLDIFLAANRDESRCDFKIEGSFFERSCTIYLGDSNTIIAQMHKKHTVGNIIMGKDVFGVTVYPNVDYAFIVALIVVLDGINEERAEG